MLDKWLTGQHCPTPQVLGAPDWNAVNMKETQAYKSLKTKETAGKKGGLRPYQMVFCECIFSIICFHLACMGHN